jgi:hypothetical protein
MQFVLSKENLELSTAVSGIVQNKCVLVNQDMASQYICHKCTRENNIYGGNLTNDIELFNSFSGDDNTLFKQVDRHCTTGGSKVYLKYMLQSPLRDCGALIDRQSVIKKIEPLTTEHKDVMERIKENENSFLSLFGEEEETIKDVYKMVYYRSNFTSWLNGDEYAITALNVYSIIFSPSIGVLSPIMYFIVPYLVLYFKLGISMPFKSYIQMTFKTMFMTTSGILGKSGGIFDNFKYISYAFSLIFYFQSMFNSIELSTTMYKISNLLTNKVNNVIQFIRDCQTIVDAYWNVEIPNDVFGCNVDKYDVDTYFQNVSTEPFSLLSNFGSRLKIFKNIKPEAYVPLIQQVYMLDTCWAIKQKVQLDKYAFAKFTSNNVECNMTDMWHPCIAPEVVVHNNVKLGGDSDIRNMIVTGPNAGGKSTLIKAILSNVLLSQTLTIVAAKSSTISPFHLIHSQINIPDCKGKESLFEAEMHRSKESIDMLKECRGPSLIVMDEIFNSTNPIEGISGAYAIAKQIGSYKTNITIISTHYLYLTKLAAKLKHFANYKMGVEISGDDIKFPYKLKKGICKQFIALELLKQNGFDAKIIKDAIEIKQLLTTKK